MNKSDLVNAVSDTADITKADAARVIDAVFQEITLALARGKDVQLIGFGNFTVRKRLARTGRNPKTGAPLEIPASSVPVFKAGKKLKEAV
jgi:DNA-binding protein HU-beta